MRLRVPADRDSGAQRPGRKTRARRQLDNAGSAERRAFPEATGGAATRADLGRFVAPYAVSGLSLWKKALGCTTFQPHWKAFFNPKAPLLAQKNDALRLTLDDP